jgi:type I restriction enzyme S subunit
MKKGWTTKPLGEVCEIIKGRKPELKPTQGKGDLPYLVARFMRGVQEPEFASVSDRNSVIVEESETIIICDGSNSGEVFTGYRGILSSTMGKIAKKAEVDDGYLRMFLASTFEVFNGAKTGSAIPHLDKEAMYALEFSFPPLAEQQRIVGVLDEAFAGLATAQAHAAQNLQNARALFESHLQSVFTDRGQGWVETTLGDIGKVSMCKRIFKEETTAIGDIPFYKIGTFGKEPDAFIPIQTYNEYRAKYSFPKKGDVLISASGTIGRRVRYDGEPAYFQDSNIVWIDNDEKQVLNDYLYHFYGACEWNSTKGATISRLYNDNLRGIAIAFPETHREQQAIVTQLDALAAETQRLTRLYEQKQAALAALKKSLLHQAFTGAL